MVVNDHQQGGAGGHSSMHLAYTAFLLLSPPTIASAPLPSALCRLQHATVPRVTNLYAPPLTGLNPMHPHADPIARVASTRGSSLEMVDRATYCQGLCTWPPPSRARANRPWRIYNQRVLHNRPAAAEGLACRWIRTCTRLPASHSRACQGACSTIAVLPLATVDAY